ncbi:Trm112 family protein [Sulfuracidifex tepidarius]|uniref:Trm112 family protein n=1 Tax=Sulfuracidifex tepidarius TaxID=1294262 RepID=UPI0006D0D9A5|nr:Trm112 family protein [Sulfuracidifex tepidarius]
MKYKLMDVLACPICKNFPLKLKVFSEKEVERMIEGNKPLCELYCSFKDVAVKSLENAPCEECIRKEIVEGIIVCEKCGRWYPIVDEIPRMLPDGLRKKNDDIKFLREHEKYLSEDVKTKGLPFNLSQ